MTNKSVSTAFHELLHEVPVGLFVGRVVTTVELHAIQFSRVVVGQAGADEVAVRDLASARFFVVGRGLGSLEACIDKRITASRI